MTAPYLFQFRDVPDHIRARGAVQALYPVRPSPHDRLLAKNGYRQVTYTTDEIECIGVGETGKLWLNPKEVTPETPVAKYERWRYEKYCSTVVFDDELESMMAEERAEKPTPEAAPQPEPDAVEWEERLLTIDNMEEFAALHELGATSQLRSFVLKKSGLKGPFKKVRR